MAILQLAWSGQLCSERDEFGLFFNTLHTENSESFLFYFITLHTNKSGSWATLRPTPLPQKTHSEVLL